MARRKFVKLDTKGLDFFAKTFGPNGQTFTVGLFDKKNARKGALLEFGDDDNNQVARPWLSAITFKGSNVHNKIINELADFAKDSFAGRNKKSTTADNLAEIVKQFVRLQEFPSATEQPLKDATIERKKRKGRANPSLVGIDSSDMVNAIKVRTKGGGRRKPK